MQKNDTILQLLVWVCIFSLLPISEATGQQKTTAKQTNSFNLDQLGVLKKQGVEVMIYNNSFNSGGFFDEKLNGIQMIHHNVRTVTGGAVRLSPTPEQWDLTPTVSSRNINVAENAVTLTLYYTEYDFTSRIRVEGRNENCLITVILDQPVPKALEGKAGLNIEFLPAAYFRKTYLMDEHIALLPQYAVGPMIKEDFNEKIPQYGKLLTNEKLIDAYAKPMPMALGKKLTLSPDDPLTMVTLRSATGEIGLYDGRNLANNGWYVVRELLPVNKTGPVVQWVMTPNSVKDWMKEPVISYPQIGYHPDLEKIAVIELDPNDKPLASASLIRVAENGTTTKVMDIPLNKWGTFVRNTYYRLDFSGVKTSGIYRLQYGKQLTGPFPITQNVFHATWHPTLHTWLPVQMDHMFVKEAYRIWHGNPHQDDALQAPPDTSIHDGYRMGSSTDTNYKALEHIPGLNIGGWFDAGDFDIQTGSHISTVNYLCGIWEDLKPGSDQTLVDQNRKHVAIHHPDGVPDVLQQIEHGTLALIAQHRAVGHAIRGIVQSRLFQYNSIGDAGSLTDGKVYNPKLKLLESDGLTSGVMDDRWAFTNYNPGTNLSSGVPIAAASRALKGYNDALAEECLQTALKIWEREVVNKTQEQLPAFGNRPSIAANATSAANTPAPGNRPQGSFGGNRRGGGNASTEAALAIELYLATGENRFADHVKTLWPTLRTGLLNTRSGAGMGGGMGGGSINTWLKALPFMGEDFRNDLQTYANNLKTQMDSLIHVNPYNTLVGRGGFYSGGNYSTITWALTAAKLNRVFPNIIGKEYAVRGLNYILGCHPASSISFVSGVGVWSKEVVYGNNRADFSAIPGAVVPGLYLINPDFYENQENWPYIWYENEAVVDCNAAYIYLAAMIEESMK